MEPEIIVVQNRISHHIESTSPQRQHFFIILGNHFPSPLPSPSVVHSNIDDSEREVRDLFTTYGNHGSDFEHLLDVGGIRYHLRLQYDTAEPESLGNMTLDVLYNSCSLDEGKTTNDAFDDCLGVLWSFLQSDYKLQTGLSLDMVVKLQVLTTNGVLHSQYHDHYLGYPRTKAIENCFPGVVVYTSSQVERLNKLEMDIFKVRLHGSILCMKIIHRSSRESSFIDDAKAGNVLVRRDGNVVLILFGGGYTDGWVDMNNQDTARGDLQGLGRIIMSMKEKVKDHIWREGY